MAHTIILRVSAGSRSMMECRRKSSNPKVQLSVLTHGHIVGKIVDPLIACWKVGVLSGNSDVGLFTS